MGTFLFIVVVIGIAGLILVELTKNPGDRPFSSLPSHARAEFLKRTFGITKQDCERLRFDGRHFHHPKKSPYETYRGVRANGSTRTTVTNPALPHHISWKYQRLDGGPDLRYRGNVKTMHSERHFIRFEGPQPFVLHVYSYPGHSDVDQLARKFDAFLCGAQGRDYEREFMEFKAAFEKKQLAQSRLDEAMSSLASCDAVTAAHTRMLSVMAIPADLKAKVEEAATRRLQVFGVVERLRREILEQEQQENLAVRSAQTQSEIALSHRTIAQFS